MPGIVWSRNQKSVQALLLELPNTEAITSCRIDRLTNVLNGASHGRYGRERAIAIRKAASDSIGSNSPAMAFEIQQTIRLIKNTQEEIGFLDKQIAILIKSTHTPLLTIPGIGCTLAAIILSEIGDIS